MKVFDVSGEGGFGGNGWDAESAEVLVAIQKRKRERERSICISQRIRHTLGIQLPLSPPLSPHPPSLSLLSQLYCICILTDDEGDDVF